MESDLKEIQKIVELLRKFQPHTLEEELDKQAQILWRLSLFIVRLKIKKSKKWSIQKFI